MNEPIKPVKPLFNGWFFGIFVAALFAVASALYAAVDLNVDDGGAPLSGSELVTNIEEEIVDLSSRIDAGLIPDGGVEHDIIEKQSATDQDTAWITPRDFLEADVTNNNASANTLQDVTGLQFPVVTGGRYWFRFVIIYTAAATTTGSRWSVNGPTLGANGIFYRTENSLTTISRTVTEGHSAYNQPTASDASSAATASNMAIVEGIVHAGANGNVIARHASEVSSSAIVAKAGSFVEYRRLD